MINSENINFEEILTEIKFVRTENNGLTEFWLHFTNKIGKKYCFDFLYEIEKKDDFFYIFEKSVAIIFKAGFTITKTSSSVSELDKIEFENNPSYFDNLFSEFYKKGERDFLNILNDYLIPFERTPETIAIALNYFVEMCTIRYKSNAFNFTIDIPTIALQQGMLKAIYFFIYSHFDFFKENSFSFIFPTDEPIFNQFDNLKSIFTHTKKMLFDILMVKLVEFKFIQEIQNSTDRSSVFTWKLGVNGNSNGSSYFLGLLYCLIEKDVINLDETNATQLKKILDNTFQNNFSSDNLKPKYIYTTGLEKSDFFDKLLESCLIN